MLFSSFQSRRLNRDQVFDLCGYEALPRANYIHALMIKNILLCAPISLAVMIVISIRYKCDSRDITLPPKSLVMPPL
jgi:hypothetical protein